MAISRPRDKREGAGLNNKPGPWVQARPLHSGNPRPKLGQMAKSVLQLAESRPSQPEIEWAVEDVPVPYGAALQVMAARVEAIREGHASECVWLLEHPPIYTSGTSADPRELLAPTRFPVFRTGRGGRFTYHGPGQRLAYVMLDLSARGRDVRAFVTALEDWLIATLARFGVTGERHPSQIGIFVA